MSPEVCRYEFLYFVDFSLIHTKALSDGIFTQKSDVWAMGVVIWEIVMYAMSPYPALSNQEVFDFVTAGHIMEKPEICRDDLYVLKKLYCLIDV